ncbi:MAG: glycosyltransferase family 2 protein [bacterium]
MSKIFCLILNYNRRDDTVNCAHSLLASRLPAGTQIIVIDNGSKDLRAFFSRQIKNSLYIKSPGNIGFAAGNNQGIRYALKHGATHILVINPDVIVPKDFLLPLLRLNKDLVAPAHTEGSGSYGLGGRIDWRLCSFPHDNVTKLPINPRRYDLLTFACVLIKREVFETVGLMDERYFLYLEDVDYCVTVARAGFSLYLDPSVVVTHATSSSFSDPRGKIKYSFKSSFIFIRKWYLFPGSILPILHTLYFYPYLYLLWTLKIWKRQIWHPVI